MRNALVGIVWLLGTFAGPAAEIVSWNVRLSQFAQGGLETPGIARDQAAPEASPFFNKGDELWDLTAASGRDRFETQPPLEWAVWNATSQRLVTKGDWSGVGQLHQRFGIPELPKHCRVTAEVFKTPADRSPPTPDSQAAATLTWISRSGQPFESSAASDLDGIAVSGTNHFDDAGELIDFSLNASLNIRGLPRREASFSGFLKHGVPLWVVRDHDGESGLDLRITAHVELLDGSPISAAVLHQKNGVAVALSDRSKTSIQAIGDEGWLVSAYVPSDALRSFWRSLSTTLEDGIEDGIDPFAAVMPGQRIESPEFREIQPPAVLGPWLTGVFWDLRPELAKAGMIRESDKTFAAYNPLTERILLFTDHQGDLDVIDAYFGYEWDRAPASVAVSLGPDRPMRLITRSGHVGKLTRVTSDGTVLAALSIEPVVDCFELIHLRLEFRESVGETSRSIKSSVTLHAGRITEVLTGPAIGDPPLGVTADIVR